MSKVSEADIMKNEIEQELAHGLEALDMLEFFEQGLLKGKIVQIKGSHYDINERYFRSIVANVQGHGPVVASDLLDLYRKLQEPHE